MCTLSQGNRGQWFFLKFQRKFEYGLCQFMRLLSAQGSIFLTCHAFSGLYYALPFETTFGFGVYALYLSNVSLCATLCPCAPYYAGQYSFVYIFKLFDLWCFLWPLSQDLCYFPTFALVNQGIFGQGRTLFLYICNNTLHGRRLFLLFQGNYFHGCLFLYGNIFGNYHYCAVGIFDLYI